jgi:glutamyl-tRNA synthetase
MSGMTRVTRLAPSPTGGLHLGNARTFLINWVLARQNGWQIAFRIDDLDSPRVKAGADQAAIDDLKWLGLDWDTEVDYQSRRLAEYEAALVRLAAEGKIYPCHCTRSQIAARAASAPNEGDHELRYNGNCRPALPKAFDFKELKSTVVAWRLRVSDEPVCFNDHLLGPQQVSVAAEVGDFLVANKQGVASYQLAVNLDDAAAKVTDIVRGDDLLTSTARQILIRRAFEMPEEINYWHLPLVVGEDGMRLAKRHGSLWISELRQQGVRPERIIGLIAHWSGCGGLPAAVSLNEFLSAFDIASLPRTRIKFRVDTIARLKA